LINEQDSSNVDASITRIVTPDVPIPQNIGLVESVLPMLERIRNGIETL
jgi:pyruvate/2-oxoglutarate/acetoin dehydrogenase E1 component